LNAIENKAQENTSQKQERISSTALLVQSPVDETQPAVVLSRFACIVQYA
jgi:hypothetical protein